MVEWAALGVAALTALGNIFQWVAKLKWANEYKTAIEARLAAKDDQLHAKDEQLKTKDERIETYKSFASDRIKQLYDSNVGFYEKSIELKDQEIRELTARHETSEREKVEAQKRVEDLMKSRDHDSEALEELVEIFEETEPALKDAPIEAWDRVKDALPAPGALVREIRHVPAGPEELRSGITEDQKAVLGEIWAFWRDRNERIPSKELHRRFIGGIGVAGVQAAVDRLPEGIVWRNWNDGKERYGLMLAGVLLADQGKEVERVLIPYLEYIKGRFLAEEGIERISSQEVEQALGLAPDQIRFLGRVLWNSPFQGGGSLGDEEWTVQLPHDVDELADADDVRGFLWDRALRGVAWVEEMPVWQGIEWEGGFIACAGPLGSLKEEDAVPHDPRAIEALKAAGYECRFSRSDRVHQRLSVGYRFAYETDRRSWKRKLYDATNQYLMVRRQGP